MRAFAAPKVQSARNCRVKEEPGGGTLNAASGQLFGLRSEPRIARWVLGN